MAKQHFNSKSYIHVFWVFFSPSLDECTLPAIVINTARVAIIIMAAFRSCSKVITTILSASKK